MTGSCLGTGPLCKQRPVLWARGRLWSTEVVVAVGARAGTGTSACAGFTPASHRREEQVSGAGGREVPPVRAAVAL